MSLAVMVGEYLQSDAYSLEREVKRFRGLSIMDAIKKAVQARDENGNIHIHQWPTFQQFPNVPTDSEAILLQAANEISECDDFETLHWLIKSKLVSVNGAGRLYWYDTAFRIGISLNIFPDKVYLHRGAAKGADDLGLRNASQDELEKADIVANYPELQALEPYQIEDFLCIGHRQGKLLQYKRA